MPHTIFDGGHRQLRRQDDISLVNPTRQRVKAGIGFAAKHRIAMWVDRKDFAGIAVPHQQFEGPRGDLARLIGGADDRNRFRLEQRAP